MATGSYTYGTVARVQALVGDIVSARAFTTTTVPTLAQVEALLDDIAAEINNELLGARYTVDTAAVVATGTPRASELLVAMNSFGAAAAVLETLPNVAVLGGEEEGGGNRASRLRAYYRRGLDMIKNRRLNLTRSAFRVFAGSQEDADGNVKKPIFTRSVTDYPNTWSLTK